MVVGGGAGPALSPDYIAPLVGFLAHEATTESGAVFEVGSGWIAKLRRQQAHGVILPITTPIAPEAVAERIQEVHMRTCLSPCVHA
jgi:multifunctional beta-oxidation protein